MKSIYSDEDEGNDNEDEDDNEDSDSSDDNIFLQQSLNLKSVA